MRHFLIAFLAALFGVTTLAAKTLDVYLIDVEGGKALLIVSPVGESMLIDAGFPGSRDIETESRR